MRRIDASGGACMRRVTAAVVALRRALALGAVAAAA